MCQPRRNDARCSQVAPLTTIGELKRKACRLAVLIVSRRWSKIETTSGEEIFMVSRRKLALYLLTALALAGAYDALRNLPVLSGCNFYSDCPVNFSSGATASAAD